METGLSEREQLVVLAGIRKAISSSEEPAIGGVIDSTKVLMVISQVLRFDEESHELIRYMKVTLLVLFPTNFSP